MQQLLLKSSSKNRKMMQRKKVFFFYVVSLTFSSQFFLYLYAVRHLFCIDYQVPIYVFHIYVLCIVHYCEQLFNQQVSFAFCKISQMLSSSRTVPMYLRQQRSSCWMGLVSNVLDHFLFVKPLSCYQKVHVYRRLEHF